MEKNNQELVKKHAQKFKETQEYKQTLQNVDESGLDYDKKVDIYYDFVLAKQQDDEKAFEEAKSAILNEQQSNDVIYSANEEDIMINCSPVATKCPDMRVESPENASVEKNKKQFEKLLEKFKYKKGRDNKKKDDEKEM